MSWLHSLRTRLILAYTLLIVLGFGGLAWLAGAQLAGAAREDFARGLVTQAGLVARSLREDMEKMGEREDDGEGEDRTVAVTERARYLADQVGAQYVILDRDGRVWFDGAGTPPGEPPINAPEVAAALAGRAGYAIRADATGISTIYAAAPIEDEQHVLAVVQLARPVSVSDATVQQRWWTLAGGVGALAVLALVAALILAASLTRPLDRLRLSALRLAAGDLDQRLSSHGPDEIRQVAAAFNHMAGQVQMMIEEQRAFAGNASHELRTPLTTIRIRSEALRQGDLPPALTRQYIAEIDDEVARLGGLVEDLILLSRLDAGRAEVGVEEVDLARLGRGLLRELGALPEAQDKQLQLDAPNDLPAVRGSSNHLRVLLRNLLSNAILYTPPGGEIVCRFRAADGGVEIAVADTGQGIAAEDLAHVAERFFRTDKAHTRTIKGAGLGLALVQSIVDFYGGRLAIASPGLGQGTTVTVWWPLEPTPHAQAVAA